jgi:hypothetical protein
MDIVWQAEDSLRERKVESDLKDLLKTMVAFANSVAPEDVAQIFIGVTDDGTIQGLVDPDSIEKSVKKQADKIYPEIYYKCHVFVDNGKSYLRVDIRHNGLAPHFGGPAWVRRGSETIKATEQVYQQMVELRSQKTRKLAQWLNVPITVEGTSKPLKFASPAALMSLEWSVGKHRAELIEVNSHWVTFRVYHEKHHLDVSEPVERLLLSWDHENKRPKVLIVNWVNE